jgi:serine/threonine protein kinase
MLERSMRSSAGLAVPNPYLAPEQITQNMTDVRTDAFLVGIILYELLARRPLFLRDNANHTREAILEARVGELPRHVPEKIAEVAYACLEKNPAFRPQTAASLKAKLLEALEHAERAGEKDGEPAEDSSEEPTAPRGFLRRFLRGTNEGGEGEPVAAAAVPRTAGAPPSPREELANVCARLR